MRLRVSFTGKSRLQASGFEPGFSAPGSRAPFQAEGASAEPSIQLSQIHETKGSSMSCFYISLVPYRSACIFHSPSRETHIGYTQRTNPHAKAQLMQIHSTRHASSRVCGLGVELRELARCSHMHGFQFRLSCSALRARTCSCQPRPSMGLALSTYLNRRITHLFLGTYIWTPKHSEIVVSIDSGNLSTLISNRKNANPEL